MPALTATERALLQKLADERGHIVTYDAVCEAVWGADYYGYENSLNVHIRHLREKIEPDPGRPQWLVTARGIGYKLSRGDVKLKTFTRMIRALCAGHGSGGAAGGGPAAGADGLSGAALRRRHPTDRARIGTLAEALTPTADGLQLDPAQHARGLAAGLRLGDGAGRRRHV